MSEKKGVDSVDYLQKFKVKYYEKQYHDTD